jgi:hypothetical protein
MALGFREGSGSLSGSPQIGEQYPAERERGRRRSRILWVLLDETSQGRHRRLRVV